MAISDTNRIAAAGNDPTGSTSGPMDNTNARAIYGLLDKTIVGNYRPIDFYRAIVSEVGVYSASAQTQKKAFKKLWFRKWKREDRIFQA